MGILSDILSDPEFNEDSDTADPSEWIVAESSRPLLLVDVDGVLNPYGARDDFEDFTPVTYTLTDPYGRERSITSRFSPRHGLWLQELSQVFDLVWATSWQAQANEFLSPLLGLPALPFLTVRPRFTQSNISAKLEAADDQIPASRPYLWFDDEHLHFEPRGPRKHTPTVYHWVDARTGLTRDDIDTALVFAESLGV